MGFLCKCVPKDNRGCKWKCLLLLGLFVGVTAAAVVLGLLWNWEDDSEEFSDDDGIPPEFEGLTSCFDITRNMDDYWKCIVRGDYLVLEGKVPPPGHLPPEEVLNGSVKAYKILKRVRRRAKRSTKRKRVRRSFYYTPYSSNYTLEFEPMEKEEYLSEYPANDQVNHDYHRAQIDDHSELLYSYDKDNPKQRPPPWSYRGNFPPNKWHELDIAKFVQKVDKSYELTEAMFKDLATETLFGYPDIYHEHGKRTLNYVLKLHFWDPLKILSIAYKNRSTYSPILDARDRWPPPYVLINTWYRHKSDRGYATASLKTYPPKQIPTHFFRWTLSKHNPNDGYYSGLRFLLPPGVEDKVIVEYIKQGLLKRNFLRPRKNAIDFRDLYKYMSQLVKEKNDPKRKAEYKRFSAVSQWYFQQYATNRTELLENDKVQFYRPQFQLPDHLINDSFVGDVLRQLQVLITFQREGPRTREYYSLPLLPRPFRMCRHREQSPIDIQTKKAHTAYIGSYYYPHNYCKRYRVNFRFREDGTNVLIARFQSKGLYVRDGVGIRGGVIKGRELFLDEMHIHIGKEAHTGSEHKINGKGYAMELQLIFTITGSDLAQPYHYVLARQLGDLFQFREKLVLMIALLVEVVEKPANPYLFEPLVQVASKFRQQQDNITAKKYRGYTTKEPVWALSDFMPRNSKFYTYRGTLTTPPCFSYVLWSVFEEPLQISKEQYEELKIWPTPDIDGGFLAGNVRTMDDLWVEEEHVKDITPEAQRELRAKREGRMVLKSDPDLKITAEDYEYDYYAGASISTQLCVLTIVISVSVLITFKL